MLIQHLLMYVSAVYIFIRGTTTTSTTETGRIYTKDIPPKGSVAELTTFSRLSVTCSEFIHVTLYDRWFIPNRKRFTYHVSLSISDRGDSLGTIPDGCYPRLCCGWLSGFWFPHLCAIEAHVEYLLSVGILKEPITVN